MNKPIVTVIIPTYKRTKFIKRAVQSVLDQTYDNIEILIVDDNIKDSKESQYIKINVETMDDRIRVIKTKGFGQTSMGQDFRFMLSCCTRGLRIGYMKGAYVHQYLHSGERISIGNNKIEGEKALFAIKSKYLSMLSPKERKYVKFRHFAVLMFTYIRSNQAVKAIPYAIAAFVTSPSDTLLESKRYFGGRMK